MAKMASVVIKLNEAIGFFQELSLFALKLRNSVKNHTYVSSDNSLIFILN